ncbi:casein kinase subunit II beta [Mycena galericulata]|nr:casein kinase subunit II beta [Mycena galericulata]
MQWISWFLSSKGNEYFCEVDEDFILDSFNLTGLDAEVANYDQALDVLNDRLEDDMQDELRRSLDIHARLLYGLIHARWILTARGLSKMVAKYECGDFGRCSRVLCYSQPLLPVGLVDIPFEKGVKLYCGRCEDNYFPKSSRHNSIDGAFFGTTFPHLLFLEYPSLIPLRMGPRANPGWDQRPETMGRVGGDGVSTVVALRMESYCPRVYGFRLNETAKLQRSQDPAVHNEVDTEGGGVSGFDESTCSSGHDSAE